MVRPFTRTSIILRCSVHFLDTKEDLLNNNGDGCAGDGDDEDEKQMNMTQKII